MLSLHQTAFIFYSSGLFNLSRYFTNQLSSPLEVSRFHREAICQSLFIVFIIDCGQGNTASGDRYPLVWLSPS